MADNVTVDNGALTDYSVATDKVTYSGDADREVQLTRIVQVTGAEGSKTVVDLPGDATNGLDVDVTRVSGDVTVVQATSANLKAQIGGFAAHDAAVLGNPVLVAGRSSAAAPTDVGADGRATDIWVLRNGAQAAVLTAAGALIGGDATNGLDVDVTRLPALAAGSNNIGDVDVLTVPADPFGVNADAASATGSISAKLRFIAATGIPITALPASTNTIEVVGDVAHDAAAAGNPVLNAGISQDTDDTAPPNRVAAEGRATRLATDRDGSLYVRTHGPQIWSYHDDDVAAVTTDGTVHSAPGSGLSLYVTDIIFSIGAATASSIFFEESTTKVLGPYYLDAVAGRGLHIHFSTPKKITANTALLVTNTGSISFSIDVTGYTAQG